LAPPKERDSRFLQMVCQVPVETQEGKDAAYFASVKVRHVWDPKGSTKREECEASIHGLQVLLDTRSWDAFRQMLQMLVKRIELRKVGPGEAELSTSATTDASAAATASGSGDSLHEKVHNYWLQAWEIYKRSSLKLEATDIVLVVPTYTEFPALRSASLQV